MPRPMPSGTRSRSWVSRVKVHFRGADVFMVTRRVEVHARIQFHAQDQGRPLARTQRLVGRGPFQGQVLALCLTLALAYPGAELPHQDIGRHEAIAILFIEEFAGDDAILVQQVIAGVGESIKRMVA